MNVKYCGDKQTVDNNGHQIKGRTTYLFELETQDEAELCAIKLLMFARTKMRTAELYSRGKNLYLDVPGSAVRLADELYKIIKNM